MPFIEINNIDGAQQAHNYEWLKTLSAVSIGFFLKYGTDWWQKVTERKKTAKLFESELKSLNPILKDQIVGLKIHSEEVQNHKETNLPHYVKFNFDVIRSLDKIKLIEYYQKQSKGNVNVGAAYNAIEIIYMELERLNEHFTDYQNYLDNLVKTYNKQIETVVKEVQNYMKEQWVKTHSEDELCTSFVLLAMSYFDGKTLTLDKLLELKKTFYPDLLKAPFNDLKHPMYNKINTYNRESVILIADYEEMNRRYIHKIAMALASILKRYKILYNRDFNEEA